MKKIKRTRKALKKRERRKKTNKQPERHIGRKGQSLPMEKYLDVQLELRKRMKSSSLSQEDQDTLHMLNEAFGRQQVSLSELRDIAAVRGLVDSRLRSRIWPILLGIDVESFDWSNYAELSMMDHKDTPTVQADIPRSMNQFTKESSADDKEEKRAALKRLLNAVVNAHNGDVHYYQGLHDIGAALVLTVGERLAFPILCKVATCQLRDCTRPTLSAVTELLRLIYPIVEMADRNVARVLETMGVPCFFSLSWFITWFSHDVHNLPDVARLFDLFLSSHPMMPLYVGAAGMAAAKDELLSITEMCDMHSALVNLRVGKYISTNDLVSEALNLYANAPPRKMIRRARLCLENATSPCAYLQEGLWVVPEEPDTQIQLTFAGPIQWTLRAVSGGLLAFSSKSPPISALSVLGMGMFAIFATLKVMDSSMYKLNDQAWDSMFKTGL